jgi:acyl-CoA thioesterase I
MKKFVVIFLILALLAGVLIFTFGKGTKITNFPSSGKAIVAFGDSLVAGVGSTQGKDFVSLLSQKIGEPIVNLGTSGNTTAEGLARINKVIALDPKVVIVLLGGNDALRRVPADETFRNIDETVKRLHEAGAVVILLGIRGGLLSDTYEKRFKEIAEARGALYVPDVLDGIFAHAELMDDAIHPNDAGYALIAAKVSPALERAVGK